MTIHFLPVKCKLTTFRPLTGLFYFLLAVISISFTSCHVFDKEEPTPAFLHISGFNLEVKPDNSQGSNAHDIVDAWVFVDRQLIGVFELPVTLPVLKEGFKEVIISAGIRNNGRSDHRIIYPFYTSFVDTIQLEPGVIDTIRPEIAYREGLKFPWIEDFEDKSISLEPSGTGRTIDTIHLTTDPVEVFSYDGSANKVSGYVDMKTGLQIFEASTISQFDVPVNEEIYLEMNYKTDAFLQVGFYPLNSTVVNGVPVLLLFPTNGDWKKVYISLGEDANSADNRGADIRIFFNAASKFEEEGKKIYLDNLKLIHR